MAEYQWAFKYIPSIRFIFTSRVLCWPALQYNKIQTNQTKPVTFCINTRKTFIFKKQDTTLTPPSPQPPSYELWPRKCSQLKRRTPARARRRRSRSRRSRALWAPGSRVRATPSPRPRGRSSFDCASAGSSSAASSLPAPKFMDFWPTWMIPVSIGVLRFMQSTWTLATWSQTDRPKLRTNLPTRKLSLFHRRLVDHPFYNGKSFDPYPNNPPMCEISWNIQTQWLFASNHSDDLI